MRTSNRRFLRFSPAIDAAVDAYCQANGIDFSQLARQAICKEIGQPNLAQTMGKPGRPKPATTEPPKAS